MTVTTAEPRPAPPRQTANPAPVRPAASVRRTTSIDVAWPGNMKGPRLFHGRVRDYLTPASGGAGKVLDEASLLAEIDFHRTITAISANPAPARLAELVGHRGGGHLRTFMAEIMPELLTTGAPLYLAIDDLSGTSLISGWGWVLWDPRWLDKAAENIPAEDRVRMEDRAGVCWGLQLGNSGMSTTRTNFADAADAGDLRNPQDPEGWHEFPAITGVSFRRARRIDVWRKDGLIHISAAFQDSAPRPDEADGNNRGRAALHEYSLTATADATSGELLSLTPAPHVLPFHECPGAIANTQRLLGTPLGQIRETVLAQLRGPAGCTHLNDALRALAEVPILVEKLDG